MINGVDVSKCVCLNSNLMCTQYQLQYGNLHCESKKNCYYKQMKRYNQDYERLTNQCIAVIEQNKMLQKELNNYKKLLDEYKNKNEVAE